MELYLILAALSVFSHLTNVNGGKHGPQPPPRRYLPRSASDEFPHIPPSPLAENDNHAPPPRRKGSQSQSSQSGGQNRPNNGFLPDNGNRQYPGGPPPLDQNRPIYPPLGLDDSYCQWNECEMYSNVVFTALPNTVTLEQFDDYKKLLKSIILSCIKSAGPRSQAYQFSFVDPITGELTTNKTMSYAYCGDEATCNQLINEMSYNGTVAKMDESDLVAWLDASFPRNPLLDHNKLLKNYKPSQTAGSVILMFTVAEVLPPVEQIVQFLKKIRRMSGQYLKIMVIDKNATTPEVLSKNVFKADKLSKLEAYRSDILPCSVRIGSSMWSNSNGNTVKPTDRASPTEPMSWYTIVLIMGGIVGGVMLLLVFCALAAFFWLKRSSDRKLRRKISDIDNGRHRHPGHRKRSKSDEERYQQFSGGNRPSVRRETDKWEIGTDRLDITDIRLGSGAFSIVYRGLLSGQAPVVEIHKQNLQARALTDCTVAVKMLPEYADVHGKIDFMQEINFMKDLGFHKHLVNLIACITVSEPMCLITEFCDRGDLLQLVRKEKISILSGYQNQESFLTFRDLLAFSWQIADGMDYLSSKGCIHRDLAARNILIDKNKVAKVGDFGLCRLLDRTLYTTRGGRLPIKWMSLESLLHYEYSTKSDVWSFGVLLYEMFTLGLAPFSWLQPSDMIDHLSMGRRLDRPEHTNDEMYALMSSCWLESTEQRPTFQKLRAQLVTMLENAAGDYGYVTHAEIIGEPHNGDDNDNEDIRY